MVDSGQGIMPLNTSIRIEYQDQIKNTKWIYGTRNPRYDESLVLGVYDPLFKKPILITLLNKVQGHEHIIGYVEIYLHDTSNKVTVCFIQYNILFIAKCSNNIF